MKFLIAALLLVAAASVKGATRSTRAEGPACPAEDPLVRPDSDTLNITLHPIAEIHQGGTREQVTVVGLSTFTYTYEINIITLSASFIIRTTSLELDAVYEATGYLDARPFPNTCIPSGNFTGSGEAKVIVKDLLLNGDGFLFVNLIGNKVSIRILNLDSFAFSSIYVHLGDDYLIAGNPVDWDLLNANVKACVDAELAGANKLPIVEKVRLAINEIIGELTLEELLNLLIGGGGDEGCDPRH